MKKIINFRPFLFIAIFLILGVVSVEQYILGRNEVGAIVLICTTILLFVIFLFSIGPTVKIKLIFTVVFILFYFLGGIIMQFTAQNFASAILKDMTYTVSGKVVSVESSSDYNSAFVIDDVVLDGVKDGKSKYKIMLYVNGTTTLDVGDIIKFTCALSDRSLIYENKLSSYDLVNGIKYTATVEYSQVEKIGFSRTLFEKVNIFIRDSLKTGLDKSEFSIAYGMLCGNTEYVKGEIITSYRDAGVAHVFAVSGLHIGFMASILAFIFNKLKLNKILSAVIMVAVLFIYSGVCGFTASSLRASIMFTVLHVSMLTGKKYDGLSSISVACIIVLLISPSQLFCAGFQLSFAVVAGILLFNKIFKKFLFFLPDKISSAFATAISAQIASIPVSLFHFGNFSLISVFINVLFIPVASVLFIMLFATCIVGGIFSIAPITLYLSNYFLKAVNYVILLFDYTIFMISGLAFLLFILCYYAVLLILSGKINIKKTLAIILCCVFSVVGISSAIYYNVKTYKQIDVYVIGDKSVCASVINCLGKTAIIVNSANAGFSASRIRKTLGKLSVDKIDLLILPLHDGSADVQNVCTAINSVSDISRVYYYGNDELERHALLVSFPCVEFYSCVEANTIDEEGFDISFILDGYAVKLSTPTVSAVFFSEFGSDNANYGGLGGFSAQFMVACDYVESIFSLYKAERFISYRKYATFEDGQTNGDFYFQLAQN